MSNPADSPLAASLAAVDLVVQFDEETPRRLIGELRPDLLAAGADRRPEMLGVDIVRAYGGKVLLLDSPLDHLAQAILTPVA